MYTCVVTSLLHLAAASATGRATNASELEPRRAAAAACSLTGIAQCANHGQCRAGADGTPSCRCAKGFFGRDCSRKERDCAQLRSCADCQDAANGRFCGWCAEAHYCVPKHVHRALVKRGKACKVWYEDSCPAHNRSRPSSYELALEEMADDTSVQVSCPRPAAACPVPALPPRRSPLDTRAASRVAAARGDVGGNDRRRGG